jgi:Lon protease-like protein
VESKEPIIDEPAYIPELVPLFPLPDVVLFPGAVLPLHIFEPRYRAMVADALLGQRVVAVALLKRGFEPLYKTSRAPIHGTVGVGRILEAAALEDGNYHMLLRGEARARILEELPGRPYRFARIEVIEPSCNAPADDVDGLRRRLRSAALRVLAEDQSDRERWKELFRSVKDLGTISDLIASGLPLTGELRQTMLAEADGARRAEHVLSQLGTVAALASARRAQARQGFIHPN